MSNSHGSIACPSIVFSQSGDVRGLVMLAGTGGGGERELGAGSGAAAACVGPGLEDQDHGLIERAAPRVAFAAWVPLGFAVFGAVAAQAAEGGGVAARFGQEVAAVAEHVRPLAQPGPARDELAVVDFPGGTAQPSGDVGADAEFPRGSDH